jgi:cytoskeletal protein CcmA (bactofilin family)
MDNPQRETAGEAVSVIGSGITVTGNIEASVDLQIQGKVTGDVRCATLLLGERSEVHGNIYAERVRVAGLIEGSVETKDLAVEASARIAGDVVYSRIRIANGGVIHGKIKHQPSDEEYSDNGKLRLVDSGAAEPKAQAVYIE